MSDSLNPMDCKPARLLCPWDTPGKNTGVGGHSLLQGNFLTQGSNPNLLHCRQSPWKPSISIRKLLKILKNDLQLLWILCCWLVLKAHQPWQDYKNTAPGRGKDNRKCAGFKTCSKIPWHTSHQWMEPNSLSLEYEPGLVTCS